MNRTLPRGALPARRIRLGAQLPQPRATLLAFWTCAALALGGGGSPAPRPELILQLLAALACAVWVFLPARGSGPVDRRLLAVAGLAVLLPLLQLVPLPPSLWQSLPGRELEREALDLVGAAQTWMPWSISPPLTLASLMAMLPALAAMVLAARLDLRGRTVLVAAIAFMGLVSVAIGTVQLSAGPDSWAAFYPDSVGRVFGFQANRNAEVDVLLIALVAGFAVAATRRGFMENLRSGGYAIVAVYAAILLLGAFLTGSRTGIALIPVAFVFCLMLAIGPRAPTRRLLASGAGIIVLLAAAAFALRHNGAVGRVLTRFSSGEDFRAELWTDTLYAIGQYWPAGAGMGTIVPVLTSVERLEVVDATLPNRAHNDFLELALEGGLPGLLLLAAIAALMAMLAWRAWRLRTVADRPLILFALAALIITILHSIVDYPLRSMALAHVAGIAAGLLAPFRREGLTEEPRESEA